MPKAGQPGIVSGWQDHVRLGHRACGPMGLTLSGFVQVHLHMQHTNFSVRKGIQSCGTARWHLKAS